MFRSAKRARLPDGRWHQQVRGRSRQCCALCGALGGNSPTPLLSSSMTAAPFQAQRNGLRRMGEREASSGNRCHIRVHRRVDEGAVAWEGVDGARKIVRGGGSLLAACGHALRSRLPVATSTLRVLCVAKEVDMHFHRVWGCSNPGIAAARLRVAVCLALEAGEQALGFSRGVVGMPAMHTRPDERSVDGSCTDPTNSSWPGWVVRGAVRRPRESHQGCVRQRAHSSHAVCRNGGAWCLLLRSQSGAKEAFTSFLTASGCSCAGVTHEIGRRSSTGRTGTSGRDAWCEYGSAAVWIQKIKSH